VVHHCGDEGAWWNTTGIDPTVAASAPWLETHPLAMAGDKMREAGSIATVGTDQGNGKRDRTDVPMGAYRGKLPRVKRLPFWKFTSKQFRQFHCLPLLQWS
jgi:hypothetical protein